MRGLVGRLNHRDAVFSNLNAILLAYPSGRQFTDDFPDLKSIIRKHFEDGVGAPASALQIAERIILSFIGQLGDEEKGSAFDAILRTGRQGFAAIAERHVRGARDQRRERADFVTQLVGVALFMAGRMAEEGTIGRYECDGLQARLAAALSPEATAAKRLGDSFNSP
jgi:hypothetical protein